jgi:predicted pyridoxine 5'-phosphate oxidase superfamily flavin-nucleotide-binding protein
MASFHPRGGADASHRGGRAGFVRVLDEDRLAFADYPGNNMFNTFVNLIEYPRAGLGAAGGRPGVAAPLPDGAGETVATRGT